MLAQGIKKLSKFVALLLELVIGLIQPRISPSFHGEHWAVLSSFGIGLPIVVIEHGSDLVDEHVDLRKDPAVSRSSRDAMQALRLIVELREMRDDFLEIDW